MWEKMESKYRWFLFILAVGMVMGVIFGALVGNSMSQIQEISEKYDELSHKYDELEIKYYELAKEYDNVEDQKGYDDELISIGFDKHGINFNML